MDGIAVWITGLPGSGKSTIADAVKDLNQGFIVLRMDELREMVTPEPTYSEAERELVYRSLVYMAVKLTGSGHNVIIDATGNMRRWRELARLHIPGYIEVYLKCPLEFCRSRESARKETRKAPRDIYKKAGAGWPVPGVNVSYEEPVDPEIVIESDHTSPLEAARIITDFITRKMERTD
jgi:adenylylsulfate kinase